MKRLIVLLLLAAAAFPTSLYAQVSVTATLGTTGPTTYATLSAAFAAVNAGTHQGMISITITANTTEASAATLSASGTGSSSYTSISVTPSGARTVTGSFSAAPLIDLAGADNVSIDGLNSGGNSLTISNTNTSTSSGTSTIRFISSAQGNTVTNCTVLGSFAGSASGASGGTIFFSTASGTGNNNNTISNNNIGPAGANLHSKAISGNGTSSAPNTNISITNNKIFDYFTAANPSAGIYINGSNSAWTITGNRFYQTASRTLTSGSNQHSALWIAGSPSGMTFSNNVIGYSSSTGTGTYTYSVGNGGDFIPIFLQAGTAVPTTISGNTITAIAVTGSSAGTTSSSPFRLIFASAGDLVITGNTIGSNSAAGAITYTPTLSSTCDAFGVYLNNITGVTFSNNIVGGITTTVSGSSAFGVYGVRFNTVTNAVTVQNNSIGGSVANSLRNNSTATSSVTAAFQTNAAGTYSGNSIKNISGTGGNTTMGFYATGLSGNITLSNSSVSNVSAAGGSSSTVAGIYLSNTANVTATSDTVTAISYSGLGGTANGMQIEGGAIVNVSRCKIYDIVSSGAGTAGTVNGLITNGGVTVNINNNMIGDVRASAVSVADAVRGIAINSSSSNTAANVSFNSVYLNAPASSGTNFGTAALYHRASATATTNALTLRNNILVNLSTPKGSGFAVALRRSATNLENYAAASNNNLFYAGTPGAANLIYYDGTNADQTLAAFKARVTTRETASITGSPTFLSTTGSSSNFLRINTTEPTS
ncbi:MAG: hypothetical protein EOO15_13085, partial [Chitinophagaceae bacterium]